MKLALDQRIERAEKRVEQLQREVETISYAPYRHELWYMAAEAENRLETAVDRLHKLRKARERMTG